MDRKAVDEVDMKFPQEVLAPTSSISSVEEQGANSSTQSNIPEVNASSDLVDKSIQQPEVLESKCIDDIVSLVHTTVESSPVVDDTLEQTTVFHLKDSDVKSDAGEESGNSQSIHGQYSATILPEEIKPVTDITDMTNNNITAGRACEQIDVHRVQSVGSTSFDESCSLPGQDSGIQSDDSKDKVHKRLEESTGNLTQHQLHHECLDVVSVEDACDTQLKTCGTCNTTEVSDVNTSQLETQLTVSPLETPAGEVSDVNTSQSETQLTVSPLKTPAAEVPDVNTSQSETQLTVSPLKTPAAEVPDVNTSQSETQLTVSPLETPAAETAVAHADQESVYYIKWITFGTCNVPIITQNENGPCPLLAIMNVLLLKEKVKLAPMLEMITSEQLMTYLGECIFENMPQNLSETTQANYEQNMQDAMSVMYKLQTGLDVNVKFTGVGDFEYTPELIIFDLLGISLYHGWLVDPQDSDTVNAVNQCSYNQLVEKIISLRHSEEEENVRQALISEQFLDRTASQLTYHGLCELSSLIKEKELCVFFRNNHFNTLYKHNNELFLLVTDQGFLTECNVVWETLSNVDGDCHFTDASFRTYTKPAPASTPIPDPGVPVGSPEQIDHDYQVALFLQEEDASLQNQAWGTGPPQAQTSYTFTDHEYAMRLQEEENRQIAADYERTASTAAPDSVSQQQGQGLSQALPADGQRRRVERGERKDKEDKSCLIL
ncbi:hypothetical protein BsWGS_18826 [Bradybaena similaris]